MNKDFKNGIIGLLMFMGIILLLGFVETTIEDGKKSSYSSNRSSYSYTKSTSSYSSGSSASKTTSPSSKSGSSSSKTGSSTDIDGIIELDAEKGNYDILVYDNVPGGAGHVKRLVDKQAIVESLKAALEKVSQNCCDENTSCYNCLRNYYNQTYHNKLQRKLAKEFIEMILSEI